MKINKITIVMHKYEAEVVMATDKPTPYKSNPNDPLYVNFRMPKDKVMDYVHLHFPDTSVDIKI